MSLEKGIFLYTGDTQFGKTTKAEADLRAAAAATGNPFLIVDLVKAANWENQPHVPDLRAAICALWKNDPAEPRESCIWTPADDIDEFNAMMRAIFEQRFVHVLVDEFYWVCNKRSISKPMTRAVRAWHHLRASFHLTTQRPNDLHDDIWACRPRLYSFHTEGPKDQETLRKERGWTKEQLEALPVGKYETNDPEDPACRKA